MDTTVAQASMESFHFLHIWGKSDGSNNNDKANSNKNCRIGSFVILFAVVTIDSGIVDQTHA